MNRIDPSLIETCPRGQMLHIRLSLRDGLHTRPAARVAQTAQQYQSNIVLMSETSEADAKSLLDVLSLAPQPNEKMMILAKGPDANEALLALAHLLEHLED